MSGLAVAGKNEVERCYTARVFCLERSFSMATFYIAISWDVTAHYKIIDKYYKEIGAEEGPCCLFLFDKDSEEISVDIPMLGGVEHNGWRIFPLVPPIVRKEVVDSFQPQNEPRPPSLQLRAKALNPKEVRSLCFPLSLRGTSQPETILLLTSGRIGGPDVPAGDDLSPKPWPVSSSGNPPTRHIQLNSPNTQYFNVLYEASCKAAKNKWKEIGNALKLDRNDMVAIETEYREDSGRCYYAILTKWFESSTNCYFDVFTDALRPDNVELSPLIPHLEEVIYEYTSELQESSTSGQRGVSSSHPSPPPVGPSLSDPQSVHGPTKKLPVSEQPGRTSFNYTFLSISFFVLIMAIFLGIYLFLNTK